MFNVIIYLKKENFSVLIHGKKKIKIRLKNIFQMFENESKLPKETLNTLDSPVSPSINSNQLQFETESRSSVVSHCSSPINAVSQNSINEQRQVFCA